MAEAYKENKKILVRPGYTLEERINILENKIKFYKNKLREAKTLEESDKYTDAIKKIYFYLTPLKKGYCSESGMLN